MPTLTEKIDSRNWSTDGSVTFYYTLRGTANDVYARTLLLSSTPTTYEGLVREENPLIEANWVDTVTGDGQWDCTVRFAPREDQPSEIGSVTIEWDTSGGTQHITQSLETIGRYPPSTAENFHGAIGVTRSGVDATVEGVDIIVPVFTFRVKKVWKVGQLPNVQSIVSLTGKVNSNPFTVVDTVNGFGFTFAPGECRFDGASFSGQRSDGGAEIVYQFSTMPNRTNIKIGDITIPSKKGWEYLWVRYMDEEGDSTIITKPVDVHVEKVYELDSFAPLGL